MDKESSNPFALLSNPNTDATQADKAPSAVPVRQISVENSDEALSKFLQRVFVVTFDKSTFNNFLNSQRNYL